MIFLKWPISLQTIVAMCVGVAVGIILGPKAVSFGFLAKYIIEFIKTAATPLLFLAIFDAFVSIEIKGKGFLALIFVCIFNACCAITIALAISHFFKPGTFLIVDPLLKAQSSVPKIFHLNLHWSEYFSKKEGQSFFTGTTAAILSAVILGLVFKLIQFALGNRFKNTQQRFQVWNQKLLNILYKVIGVLVHLTPLAVFSAMAKVIGVQGFSAVKGLGAYLLACAGGMFLQVFLVYQSWIKFVAKHSLKRFWKEIKEPMIYSFGVNSSLATLPLTLQSLKRLKVSEGSARLSACIGTNLNNDGILLYEVVAALFIAQAFGWNLALGQQLILAMICIVATLGVAGVPDAGVISLSLVLSSVGLPLEILPVLMTVDWILARLRSVNNVVSDVTGGIALDALLKTEAS